MLPLVRSLAPDVVLMDVRMPAVDGCRPARAVVFAYESGLAGDL